MLPRCVSVQSPRDSVIGCDGIKASYLLPRCVPVQSLPDSVIGYDDFREIHVLPRYVSVLSLCDSVVGCDELNDSMQCVCVLLRGVSVTQLIGCKDISAEHVLPR